MQPQSMAAARRGLQAAEGGRRCSGNGVARGLQAVGLRCVARGMPCEVLAEQSCCLCLLYTCKARVTAEIRFITQALIAGSCKSDNGTTVRLTASICACKSGGIAASCITSKAKA